MSLKPVYVASTEPDAEIIRSLLKNAGIEAALSTDDGGGMFPSLEMIEGVGVLVDDSQVEDALAVLAAFERGETAIDDSQAE